MKPRKIFFLKCHFLSLTWAAVVLVLTLIPGKAIPDVPIFGIDKLVHFFIFGTQMFLTLLGFDKQQPGRASKYNAVPLAYMLCLFFGCFIEVLQQYVPGRSCSLYDIIANSIGIVLGHLLYKYFYRKIKKTNREELVI